MPRILVAPFTIAPESIDMNGHVNNQEYVRWMQDIATAHSHEQGWTVARYLDTRTTWVIRSHYIEYIRPAFLGDVLMVATWVAGMDAQTSPRKYRFVRARDGKTVVEAETLWVYCDATSGRPLAITPDIRDAFPVVSDDAEIMAAIAKQLTDTSGDR
jgi:acyl-CoA thioester hydrolase